jgi:hypothetical protein
MSWIIIGALISDFIVIDKIRYFPEHRDTQSLLQVHPDGRRWGLSGCANYDDIAFKEREWSFYQACVKDQKAGFATLSRFLWKKISRNFWQ